MFKRILLYLLPCFLLWSCSLSDGSDGLDTPLQANEARGVFICNEGNYTYGNASVSFYDVETDRIIEPLPLHHNGYLFPLGDVCQSMYLQGDKGFIVVNNSSKVYVIDIRTNNYLGKIDQLTSPRYIEFINEQKAYITDLYNPAITIIDPRDYTKIGMIPVGGGTEQTVRYKNRVFACSWSYSNQIFMIDTDSDQKIGSLTVTLQPNSMVLDRNNKIWVLSDGSHGDSPMGQEIPALTRIDPETFTIESVFPFDEMECAPTKLTINGTKDRLYFLNSATSDNRDGVYSMSIDAEELPSMPLISEKPNELFYTVGVDPSTGDIYVSDAIDYTQKGIIFRYDANGTLLKTFKAGIIPGSFCFRTEDPS